MGCKKIILLHILNMFMISKKITRAFFIIMMILFFIQNPSYSQEELTFENVDAKSYDFYKNQKWNALIRLGEQAIEERIDFYSLRIRLGTAYYKTKNYFSAITNFEKALDIGYSDELIYEYLYYSYLFTGRIEDKSFVFSKLSDSKKNSLRPLYNSVIDNVFTEFGKGFSNDGNQFIEMKPELTENSYSKQVIFGDYYYFKATISQLPFEWLNVTYDYSYYNFNKRWETYSRRELLAYESSNDYIEKQNRFYNRLDILVAKGFIVSPAGHYINLKESRIRDTMVTDPSKITPTREETNIDNFILSLAISKYISKFGVSVNGSFSYLNDKHQSQYGIEFKSYPFGSISFFTKTNATLHYQNKISNLVFTQLLGLALIKNLNFRASVTIGKIQNFNDQNGNVVFNDADFIKFKFGAALIYKLSNNLAAHLTFDHQQRERNFITYSAFTEISNPLTYQTDTKKFDYKVNLLSAGIKFYF